MATIAMATMVDSKQLAAELLNSIDINFVAQAVIPGDDVTEVVTRQSKRIKLAGGLASSEASSGPVVKAVRAGVLRYVLTK